MHELAVTESLLEIALRHARQAEASQIRSLNIVIGEYSSIVDDSVQFYWELIAAGTPAQNARLNFQRVPARMECLDCKQQYQPGKDDFTCPACHSPRAKIITGREFYLESIEVDKGEVEI